MKRVKTVLLAAVAVANLCAPALAQDAEFQLPEQCTASAPGATDHPMGHDGHGGMHDDRNDDVHAGMTDMMGMSGMDPGAMPAHVRENMRKMMITMPAMHEGMMNQNADVAFACGMIAHHQGAIDMAHVLLEHGKDPQTRALAEEIIEAQIAEIEQMTEWLTENEN